MSESVRGNKEINFAIQCHAGKKETHAIVIYKKNNLLTFIRLR